jgi:hypothetical protein
LGGPFCAWNFEFFFYSAPAGAVSFLDARERIDGFEVRPQEAPEKQIKPPSAAKN